MQTLFQSQIFGEPIFTYSYREAVIDGYLIDQEPPIRIETALTRAGITFQRDEQLEIFDPRTGKVDLVHAPDEIRFEVESFNRRVITQEFNRVVAEELAKHIDPSLPGKTLVFAATDGHADILVNEIKKAMQARYGEIEDAAVRKVTGSVDRVGALIRSYRNDALPIGFVINYSPDQAVRFDLNGQPTAILDKAVRPGTATLHLGGRPIPAEALGLVFGN